MEDATLTFVETPITYLGDSDMFYGDGYITNEEKGQVLVMGMNFFDLSSIDTNGEYHGTMVYAKNSHQFIDYEKENKS